MQKILKIFLPNNWVPYIMHMRPRGWPILSGHLTIGFFLAAGLQISLTQWIDLFLAAFTWSVLGNGGTLALNSAFDKDEGDIGYLDNPPEIPKHLVRFSLICMFLGIPISALINRTFFLAYLALVIMSILYSVPPIRLKARAGWDVLINSVGYGSLTIFAGWSAANAGFKPPILIVLICFFILFTGAYPLTQIYQIKEDKARGDNTFAVALGKRRALLLSICAMIVGLLIIFIPVTRSNAGIRAIGIPLAAISWLLILIPWYRKFDQVDEKYEKKGFYKATYAWALTDLAIVLALMPI
ncbi:MAG: UbiA prenyltransferase family protein [Anaerolineaceae bacterium]|nr:UbiA prenyltransferase family protein [Anaerolineaceae bacterium]